MNNYGDYSYLDVSNQQVKENLMNDADKNDLYFGYFISSLSKYTDQEFSKNLLLTNAEKPILILPSFVWVREGVRILAGGKPWKIINIDNITNPNICYCSLDFDFVDKQPNVEEVAVEDAMSGNDSVINGEDSEEERVLKASEKIIMRTTDAYFVASEPVNIVSKTASLITFMIPYGIKEITITTKNKNNEEVIERYKVV